MPNKTTICLWYNGTALDAATFYAKTGDAHDDELDGQHIALPA